MRIIFAIGALAVGLTLSGCSSEDAPKKLDPTAEKPPVESGAKVKSGVSPDGVRTIPKKK